MTYLAHLLHGDTSDVRGSSGCRMAIISQCLHQEDACTNHDIWLMEIPRMPEDPHDAGCQPPHLARRPRDAPSSQT